MTIAKPIMATWRIQGIIGKNTVDVVELTALKNMNKQKF